MAKNSFKVVVLGASNKPERYSYKAVVRLKEHGYDVVPVHPALAEIDGTAVVHRLADVAGPVCTLTVYVGPARIGALIPDIVALAPERIIMNPGAESDELERAAADAGIRCVRACTLVLLATGQFDKA